MSSVSAGSERATGAVRARRLASEHKWKLIVTGTTLFWFVWGYLLDLVFDWDLAGGVTAAFAFVWLFNVVFVVVFLQIIKLSTRWAER
jgi:hypothetical protein